MDCCLKNHKVKKIHIETPEPRSPRMERSPSQIKKESSENLKIALEKYQEHHPPTLIIHSPKSGLEKRKIYNF
jgi:hypothetical protein